MPPARGRWTKLHFTASYGDQPWPAWRSHDQDAALRLGCRANVLCAGPAPPATPGAFVGDCCSLQFTPGFASPGCQGGREGWGATSWQADMLSGQPQHALLELERSCVSVFRLALESTKLSNVWLIYPRFSIQIAKRKSWNGYLLCVLQAF